MQACGRCSVEILSSFLVSVSSQHSPSPERRQGFVQSFSDDPVPALSTDIVQEPQLRFGCPSAIAFKFEREQFSLVENQNIGNAGPDAEALEVGPVDCVASPAVRCVPIDRVWRGIRFQVFKDSPLELCFGHAANSQSLCFIM